MHVHLRIQPIINFSTKISTPLNLKNPWGMTWEKKKPISLALSKLIKGHKNIEHYSIEIFNLAS